MNPQRLILKNQFGEESINVVLGTYQPLVPDSDIVIFSGATTPVNGDSGTGHGVADKGSHYIAQDTGLLYINTGTKASPTWTLVESGNASIIAAVLTGFAAGAGTVSAADSILSAFNKVVGNQAQLQNGQLTPQSETISAAGALSTTIMESLINNASGSGFAVTLAAPSNQDGQLKVIKMGTATHNATLALTNVSMGGSWTPTGTATLTFAATGDCAIFMAVGAKWQYLGGSAVAS